MRVAATASASRVRRGVSLTASYLALLALGVFAWAAVHAHIGALAVIPLLVIAYYTPVWLALATALTSGILLTMADRDLLAPGGNYINVHPVLDAAILSASLCTVVLVSEALRRASTQNAALSDRLHLARLVAERDALTGIPNRGYMLSRLARTLESGGSRQCVALLFADLDGFKRINDTHGHLVGDRVLALAAERIARAVRAEDIVARMGGDEFAVMMHVVADRKEADALADKIRRTFTDPFAVGHELFNVGITVGIAVYPDEGADPHELLRAADADMYRRKRHTTA